MADEEEFIELEIDDDFDDGVNTFVPPAAIKQASADIIANVPPALLPSSSSFSTVAPSTTAIPSVPYQTSIRKTTNVTTNVTTTAVGADGSEMASLFSKKTLSDRLGGGGGGEVEPPLLPPMMTLSSSMSDDDDDDESSQMSASSFLSSSSSSLAGEAASLPHPSPFGVAGPMMSVRRSRVSFSSASVTSGFLHKLRQDDMALEIAQREEVLRIEKAKDEARRARTGKEENGKGRRSVGEADKKGPQHKKTLRSEATLSAVSGKKRITISEEEEKEIVVAGRRGEKVSVKVVSAPQFASSLTDLPGFRTAPHTTNASVSTNRGGKAEGDGVDAKTRKLAGIATASAAASTGVRVPAFLVGRRVTRIAASSASSVDGGNRKRLREEGGAAEDEHKTQEGRQLRPPPAAHRESPFLYKPLLPSSSSSTRLNSRSSAAWLKYAPAPAAGASREECAILGNDIF